MARPIPLRRSFLPLVGLAALTAAGLCTAVGLAGAPAAVSTTTERSVGDDASQRRAPLAAVRFVDASPDTRAHVLRVAHDVWSDTTDARVLDVVIPATELLALREAGVPLELLSADIEADALAERQRLAQPESMRPSDWYGEYKDFAAVVARLETLATAHVGRAQLDTVGHSLEGRPLRRLTFGAASEGAPNIVLNGGQHAREWIGVMVTTCVADRLLSNPDADPRVDALTGKFRFHVVPVMNPDGYQYAWDKDRYWRKNRRDGHGVDLNRNWGVGFGGRGSSRNKRSQIYRGPRAFSEPETAAMRDLLLATRPVAHIDFHSYGQLLLYPWSNKGGRSPDHEAFVDVGGAMQSAIAATHGKQYKLSAGAQLYVAGGVMTDWAYETVGAKSFVIELRPKGGNGFVLPPQEIIPTCDEALAAVLAMGETLASGTRAGSATEHAHISHTAH